MVMLKVFIGKIQKGLSLFFTNRATMVPNDVKEGQFVVFAIKGEETERFVIELSYLNNPEFVKLLELAEEEYGFKQEGALAVPCRPEELQKILGAGSGRWEKIDYCAQQWTPIESY